MIIPHPRYAELGADRPARYRELFETVLSAATIEAIRSATNGNYALGDRRLQQRIETMLGRRAAPGRPRRPSHHKGPEGREAFERA